MGYSYDRTKKATTADSLLSAKLEWAKTVAQDAADRFQNYGGWREQHVKTDVRASNHRVELTVRSDKYKWTGLATFDMEGDSKVIASVNLDSNVDGDIMKTLERFQDDVKEIPIEETASSENVVLQISLWFSRTVNKIPTN